ALTGAATIDLEALKAEMSDASSSLLKTLHSDLSEYRQENHVDPVLAAIEVLPKDELAAMAESLVNLTVLKRRMSTDQETVGGRLTLP
ncbi:MAG: hypothetical protein JWQ44_2539, partial [Chthoniobacter sp.]|nr:hypothetical protein [Chthoniobacter sp.]